CVDTASSFGQDAEGNSGGGNRLLDEQSVDDFMQRGRVPHGDDMPYSFPDGSYGQFHRMIPMRGESRFDFDTFFAERPLRQRPLRRGTAVRGGVIDDCEPPDTAASG